MEETLEDSFCAELVGEEHHGMAFGTLATVNGMGDFLSSVIVGALWAAFRDERGLRRQRSAVHCRSAARPADAWRISSSAQACSPALINSDRQRGWWKLRELPLRFYRSVPLVKVLLGSFVALRVPCAPP
jgi:hypothetical protein